MADTKKSSSLLSTSLIALGAFVLGALFMYGVSLMVMPKPAMEDKEAATTFFDAENAHVQGTVTDFTDKTITITNAKNQTETYPIMPQLLITKPNQNPAASSSAQGNTLEKNKAATINFVKKDNNYQVVSVLYSNNPLLPR